MARGYCDENPFKSLASGVRGNEKRKFFVPQEWIVSAMEHCPNVEWRTIMALARFGGLRCPSELSVLKWSDVNLPEGRFGLDSPKTGWRVVPIFKELRPYLEAAWDAAEDGAELVCPSVGPKTNLRSQFTRIIKRAGLTPWPRLIQNLRASRESELLAIYPAKDVTAWIGNSIAVAMSSYAMTSADSFRDAAGLEPRVDGGSTGGSILADTGQSGVSTDPGNPAENAPESAGDDAREGGKWAYEDSKPNCAIGGFPEENGSSTMQPNLAVPVAVPSELIDGDLRR